MNRQRWRLWALLIAVGCNGKLSVSNGDGGAAGVAGLAGAGMAGRAGAAGQSSHAGEGNKAPIEELAGAGGAPEGGSGGDPGIGGSFPVGGEAAGGSAGAMILPLPGQIGQNCVPGRLVTDVIGGPAQAPVRTLDHCNEGLACNAQGKCVPAPDCPSSGLCVFRRATLAGSGGAGGAPGGYVPGSGASGASPGPVGGGGGYVPAATAETGVVALTASDSHVYWLEYGTRDALGNYQHDGALMAYSIADGTTTTLAAGLAGPMGLELTTTHAYVYVDGAPLIGTPTQPQLLRVPLSGGSPQLVKDGAQPHRRAFRAVASRAFWSDFTTVYSMLSDADATPTEFLTEYASSLDSDDTDLYYAAQSGALMRAPLSGTGPVETGLSVYDYALYGDSVFTIEAINNGGASGGLLSRAPKSGGAFQRIRALGAGSPRNLKVVGDRYFLDVVPDPLPVENGQSIGEVFAFTTQVLTASFVGSDPPIRLLDRATRENVVDRLWVGTATALYWSEGQAIYKQPLPTP